VQSHKLSDLAFWPLGCDTNGRSPVESRIRKAMCERRFRMTNSAVSRAKTPALFMALLSMFVTVPVFAQTPETPAMSFTGDIGAGVTLPVYRTGRDLDTGWNIKGSAGVNFGRHLGVVGEFMFSRMDITGATLTALSFPGGNMDMWGLTVNPVIRLNRADSRWDAYLIGGGGLYYRNVSFTAPSVATFGAFDPFLGLVVPVNVATTEVLRSNSILKGGVNIGGGIGIKTGHGKGEFYVEPRYHHMYTRPNATTILPVTFGFRW
jgi:hypothetical protein